MHEKTSQGRGSMIATSCCKEPGHAGNSVSHLASSVDFYLILACKFVCDVDVVCSMQRFPSRPFSQQISKVCMCNSGGPFNVCFCSRFCRTVWPKDFLLLWAVFRSTRVPFHVLLSPSQKSLGGQIGGYASRSDHTGTKQVEP